MIDIAMQSVRFRTGIALAVGLASPLIMNPLSRIDPFAGFRPTEKWVIFPGLFLIVSVAVILALALIVPWSQYRSQQSVWGHTLGAVILFVVTLCVSAWCCRNHVCMAGHGCHGMTLTDRIVDVVWVLGLLGSAAWAALAKSVVCIPTGYIAGFVISYRFFFGSMGGIYPIPI
jgi:hypothetical protein